jgi:hypothetical protein
MKTPVTFTASASLVINPPVTGGSASITTPLPPVDANNTALTLTNNSGGAVWYQHGNPAVIPSGPNVNSPSAGMIQAGQTILIEGAGEAANIGLCSMAPGPITATRGTVTTAQVFA